MRIPDRLRRACRTNTAQIQGVTICTAPNIAACVHLVDCNLFAWLLALLIWPSVAFVCNLLDPIPEEG